MGAMHIRIVCPEHNAYEAEAAFVSVPASDGELGVLPRHASEIATIVPGYVRVADQAMGESDHVFAVTSGYVQIADDEVVVLAARAEDLADVNADEVRETLAGFEEQLGNLSEDDARRAYLYNEIAWCRLLLAE